MLFDLPLEQLRKYQPARQEPADFDAFWKRTLEETKKHPLAARFTPVDTGLKLVDCYDVTFAGFGGQPIKGWFVLPRQRSGKLPCIVEYIGYGGGRSLVHQWLLWANAGYAHFIMDTRGQGSAWSTGDTPDPEQEGGNPQVPGFMTRGILSRDTYYYRRVFADAVRAVEAARSHPDVDTSKIAVTGGSQGGGITLAVTGLVPDLSLSLPDVPFLCDFKRAVNLIDTDPYNEIARFCRRHRNHIEKVFETLSYFDCVNFAARAKADALFSVGLMDTICPPSTVFAAYNHYTGAAKDIRIWEYNNHEGGEAFQTSEKLRFVNSRFVQ